MPGTSSASRHASRLPIVSRLRGCLCSTLGSLPRRLPEAAVWLADKRFGGACFITCEGMLKVPLFG
jgi:hypothetical protein